MDRRERLQLKRKDLAVVLRCWGCGDSLTAPIEQVLIHGEMPRCRQCMIPMAVERATKRAS